MTGVQASGDIGEAYKLIMMANIDAMVQGTVFEGSFTIEWCWCRYRHYYPETIVPTAMFDNEDHCAEWLTFKDINQCISGTKQILLSMCVVAV